MKTKLSLAILLLLSLYSIASAQYLSDPIVHRNKHSVGTSLSLLGVFEDVLSINEGLHYRYSIFDYGRLEVNSMVGLAAHPNDYISTLDYEDGYEWFFSTWLLSGSVTYQATIPMGKNKRVLLYPLAGIYGVTYNYPSTVISVISDMVEEVAREPKFQAGVVSGVGFQYYFTKRFSMENDLRFNFSFDPRNEYEMPWIYLTIGFNYHF